MTLSPVTVDHHRPACDAMERSTPLLVAALRNAPGEARPAKMRWTNAQIGAHLYASVREGETLLRGEPSRYDAAGPTAALDEVMVAEVRERDPRVLAEMVAEQTASFLALARERSGAEPVTMPRATVSTLVGLFALDQHLHGGQFCDTAGTAWSGAPADLHHPLSLVARYAFDPEAARGFSGSYTLRLRGVQPVRYDVDDGRLTLDLHRRTDCTLSADPQTFLRFGIGLISQLRASATFKIRATGRKPWLALKVNRLFPPVPHGGVAA